MANDKGSPDSASSVIESSNASYYKYPPLHENEFLLLAITDVSHGITGSLDICSTEEAPMYDALSYAWGTGVKDQQIICNGQTLLISLHLKHALYRFYKFLKQNHAAFPSSVARIWVDAICINQHNNAQRAHQVFLMSRIYERARQVIVWLGEHENNSELAMNTVDHYGLELNVHSHGGSFNRDEKLQEYFRALDGEALLALDQLFDRSYFTRLWILHEICLATSATVLCGEGSVKWLVMESFLWTAYQSWFRAREKFLQALNTCRIIRSVLTDKNTALAEIWFGTSLKLCSEKSDHIYALLGLLPSRYRDFLNSVGLISYNIPHWTLFIHFVKYCLQTDLSLLSMASSKFKDPHLPSWCPDWSAMSFDGPLIYELISAGGNGITLRDSCDYRQLCIRGFEIGRVQAAIECTVVPEAPSKWDSNTSALFLSWESQFSKMIKETFNLDENDLVHRISSLMAAAFGALYLSYENQMDLYQRWKQALLRNAQTGEWDPTKEISDFNVNFVYRVKRGYFFLTHEGLIGFGAKDTRPGDRVYIFYGGKIPYVLRYNDDNDTAQLIGSAVVEGIMFGEALNASDKRPDEWITLT